MTSGRLPHSSAIIPLETWAFSSPQLYVAGREIDIGLFCESLIYYETVYITPGNPHLFACFLKWFSDQGKLEELRALVAAGIVKVYDYAFISTAIQKDGLYTIWNIQDEKQAAGSTFEQRYLYNAEVERILPAKPRHRSKYYAAFRNSVLSVRADQFDKALEDARADMEDSTRATIVIQALVDEIYQMKKIRDVPQVRATVVKEDKLQTSQINWNINFDDLSRLAGHDLNLYPGLPLTANTHSNRFIWSAATSGLDLYLPRPMSTLVGDKLYESAGKSSKLKRTVESLQEEVEFPSIRALVNSGSLNFQEIMLIRSKSSRFRTWLQTDAERDRNSIVAYHNEVARESDLAKFGRSSLKMFGILAGGGAGSVIGTVMEGPIGGAVGGGAGAAIAFVTDVAARIGEGWKPVVFGDWLKDRIEKIGK